MVHLFQFCTFPRDAFCESICMAALRPFSSLLIYSAFLWFCFCSYILLHEYSVSFVLSGLFTFVSYSLHCWWYFLLLFWKILFCLNSLNMFRYLLRFRYFVNIFFVVSSNSLPVNFFRNFHSNVSYCIFFIKFAFPRNFEIVLFIRLSSFPNQLLCFFWGYLGLVSLFNGISTFVDV